MPPKKDASAPAAPAAPAADAPGAAAGAAASGSRPAAGARPTGTDGSDFGYRMTVDARYKRSAAIKERLAAVSRAHLTLGFLALAWSVAVPLLLGKTTLPLPCATAATAVFCAASGSGVATGRVTQHSLEQYAKLAKAALFLGVLAFYLPRYMKVPAGPSAQASAAWAAQRFDLPLETTRNAAKTFDNALEGALVALPLIEWWYAGALRRTGDVPMGRKKAV